MNKVEEGTKLDSHSKLSKKTLICYGFGHMLNDLTSSMWFSYLLIFFHYVLNFTCSISGVMLLIGQVADGLATPLVGILSDKGAGHWLCKYGHRKSWHLIGTLCVAISFPFIFSPYFGFEYLGETGKICYYSAFITIFQFGWASVQVSHLSLAPDLTPNQDERTSLLTIRYSFAVASNIIVHLFTWFLFASYTNHESEVVGTEDRHKFQIVGLFAVALGSVFSLIFHLGVNERTQDNTTKNKETATRMKKTTVLSQFRLYHIMTIYMMSQLFVNQSQVFIPLYLEEYLHIEAKRLPVLPLIMYISSSLTSLITKALNTNYGRKPAYVVGSMLAIFTCVIVYFGKGIFYKMYTIYVVTAVFGCATSIIMVTSLGITADLIGKHTTHGAFVYGLMSFGDKISNGISVMIIQHLRQYNSSIYYYRNMLIFMCGGSAAIGLIFVVFLPKNFSLNTKDTETNPKIPTKIIYCLETDNCETKS